MKQILHRKAELIVAVLLLFTAAFAQEMEVDGDLKVQGDIIFSDETAMSSASSGIPAGILAPFAGSTAPDGWLLCDGSAVSRTTYSSLFGVIATIYGVGDGSLTFNVPDMGGKSPMGYNSSNPKFDTLAETGGLETHQLTDSQAPPLASANRIQLTGAPVSYYVTGYSGASGQSFDILDPYITLNYIIKY